MVAGGQPLFDQSPLGTPFGTVLGRRGCSMRPKAVGRVPGCIPFQRRVPVDGQPGKHPARLHGPAVGGSQRRPAQAVERLGGARPERAAHLLRPSGGYAGFHPAGPRAGGRGGRNYIPRRQPMKPDRGKHPRRRLWVWIGAALLAAGLACGLPSSNTPPPAIVEPTVRPTTAAPAPAAQGPTATDLIFHNGVILTMDD